MMAISTTAQCRSSALVRKLSSAAAIQVCRNLCIAPGHILCILIFLRRLVASSSGYMQMRSWMLSRGPGVVYEGVRAHECE